MHGFIISLRQGSKLPQSSVVTFVTFEWLCKAQEKRARAFARSKNRKVCIIVTIFKFAGAHANLYESFIQRREGFP
jgi:hypothetical protein